MTILSEVTQKVRPRKTNGMYFLSSEAPSSKSSDMNTFPEVATGTRKVKRDCCQSGRGAVE